MYGFGVCYVLVIDFEYKIIGKVMIKMDMYSFGVFMLVFVQVKEVDDELFMFLDMLRVLVELFIKFYDDVFLLFYYYVFKILRKFGYVEVMDLDMGNVVVLLVKEFFRLVLRCIGCKLGDLLISMIQVVKEFRVIEKFIYGIIDEL